MVRHHTMCSNARLRGLYRATRHIPEAGLKGDIVECGTARGGSAALMGLVMREFGGSQRRLFVFDTFEGLPPPTEEDPDFDIASGYTGTCLGTLEDVENTFRNFGIINNTVFVKGLFQDTLRSTPISSIALLHIDGDWYDSVKTCLNELYDKVEIGGTIQIDDFGFWKGARKAVTEFFNERSIPLDLVRLDFSGRQYVKTEM